jgi:hypothetical protein
MTFGYGDPQVSRDAVMYRLHRSNANVQNMREVPQVMQMLKEWVRSGIDPPIESIPLHNRALKISLRYKSHAEMSKSKE